MSAQTVVIAVDASSQAEYAVNYYLDFLHKEGNRIVLYHVIDMPETANEAMSEMLSQHALQDMWKEGRENASKLEAKYADHLKAKGLENCHIKCEGHLKPGHAICQLADKERANLIVVGTRGMGAFRRTVMGSVSDYVVHHAHCTVIICRAK